MDVINLSFTFLYVLGWFGFVVVGW